MPRFEKEKESLALFFKILCPYACHIHQTYIFFFMLTINIFP